MTMEKMKIEVWSDVMCPFCYIGKRRLDRALEQFPEAEKVEVEWKSFQLNPSLETDPDRSATDYLMEAKGWSREQADNANRYVTDMAAAEGLEYRMDQTVLANSFDAHRLLQFAKSQHKGPEMEERLFRAYFTEGANIADAELLRQLAEEVGLPGDTVKDILASDDFKEDVEKDIYESQQVGLRGVPHFVFNDRYSVSGAQAGEVFAGALERSFREWESRTS